MTTTTTTTEQQKELERAAYIGSIIGKTYASGIFSGYHEAVIMSLSGPAHYPGEEWTAEQEEEQRRQQEETRQQISKEREKSILKEVNGAFSQLGERLVTKEELSAYLEAIQRYNNASKEREEDMKRKRELNRKAKREAEK